MTKDDLVSKDTALNMAIDKAITEFEILSSFPQYSFDYVDLIKELKSCKKALDTEPMTTTDVITCKMVGKCCMTGEALEQPAQEPVAWMNDIAFSINKDELTADKFGDIVPLYTHPHQWQGLTDDEILDLEQKYTDLLVGGGTMFHFEEFARAIEAKLKDKNI